MTDYENLQARCQRGELSLCAANNLLAECRAAIGRLITENERVETENETLRTEHAGLRTGFDAQNAVIAGLKKEAERWRFVRNAIPNQSPFAVWREGSRPLFGKWADEAIDAAMGKGGEA